MKMNSHYKSISYSLISLFVILQSCSSNLNEHKISNEEETTELLDAAYLEEDAPEKAFAFVKDISTSELKDDLPNKEATEKRSTPKVNQAPSKLLSDLENEIEAMHLQDEASLDEAEKARLYAEYGKALFKEKRYKDSNAALKTAMTLHYETDGDFFYLLTANSAALRRYGEVNRFIKKAREKGFRNYRALLYSEAFEKLRKSEHHFMRIYRLAFSKNKKAMFKAYLHFAPPAKTLTEDYVEGIPELYQFGSYEDREDRRYYQKHPRIVGSFREFSEGFEKNMFSRGGEYDYRYELVLANNKHYYAIIYSEELGWGDYLLPKKYRLVTYSQTGDIISEQEIGKRGMKGCTTFVLRPDHSIAVTNYNISWKKGRKHYLKNKDRHLTAKDIDVATIQDTKHFRIDHQGNIIASEGLILGMN